MRRLAFYASSVVYFDHLVGIYGALPASVRGTFTVPDLLENYARSCCIEPALGEHPDPEAELVVVASLLDLVRALGPRQRAVLQDHGSGQQYLGDNTSTGDHGGWPGGPGRDAVDLFLCPSDRVAAANAQRYPQARTATVGCPKLDQWTGPGMSPGPPSADPVVALSFRWDCRLTPESRSAWPHYARRLREFAEHWPTMIGHAHPRCPAEVWSLYDAVGIECVRSFDEVMARASVYAVDNSSTGFEFMATDRPVVWLNAPYYRREIEHGLRFWELADSGVQCDEPADFLAAIDRALDDLPDQRQRRHDAVRSVYAFTDGYAAPRAAKAIIREACHA